MENYTTEQLISFFNLSEREKQRITRVADNYFQDQQIPNDVNQRYSYISSLVERKQLGFRRTNMISATDYIPRDEPFCRVIGLDDPSLEKLFEDKPQPRIGYDDVVNILRGNISEFDLSLLLQLAEQSKIGNNGNGSFSLTPKFILDNIDIIQQRLEQLVREWEIDGRLVIPARPIEHIEWLPYLRIQFGKRKWSKMSGDTPALDFFSKYIFVYGNMTRKQLRRIDASLYNLLLTERTIDAAIPERYGYDTTKSALQMFNERYRRKISKISEIRENKLVRLLRDEGTLDIAIPPRQKKSAIELFMEKYSGSVVTRTQLCKEDPSVYQRLIKEGTLHIAIPVRYGVDLRETNPERLIIKRRNYNKKSPLEYFKEECEDIGSRWELARKKPGLYEKIRKEKLLPFLIPQIHTKISSQQEIEKIRQMHNKSNGNAKLASRLGSWSPTTYAKHWRRAGLI